MYSDVIVLYSYRDERTAVWCEEKGWNYHSAARIYGCEAQCVVLLNCPLTAELITRARNMLIIVDNREWRKKDRKDYYWNTRNTPVLKTQVLKLKAIVDHSDEEYKCAEMSDCSYTGTNIINKIPWTGEKDQEDLKDLDLDLEDLESITES